jgi:hypothetical protein
VRYAGDRLEVLFGPASEDYPRVVIVAGEDFKCGSSGYSVLL